MKNQFVEKWLRRIAHWWFPVATTLASLIALPILHVLGILPHVTGSIAESETDLVSTVYFMTTASALTVAYWLRYGQTGFRQDAVASAAFLQLFLGSALLPFYPLAVISEILIPNIATEALIILAIGVPRTVMRKRFARKQLILLMIGPTLTSLAFLLLITLNPDRILHASSNRLIDLPTHFLEIAAAVILILEIRQLKLVQFSKSLTGLCVFSTMQAAGVALHELSGSTFDIAWWLSSVFIWQSLVFVAWGMLQDYRWFNIDLRGSFKVMRDGHSTLSSLTHREHPSSVIELIPPVFESASAFCYTSMDGVSWELELEAMSYKTPTERMPRELILTDSVSVLTEANATIFTSQDSDMARKLLAASKISCVSVIAKTTNGRYHMIGMREKDRIWWERAEVTMLSLFTSISTPHVHI